MFMSKTASIDLHRRYSKFYIMIITILSFVNNNNMLETIGE